MMPMGVYPMTAIESSLNATKDGSGSFLSYVFSVADGPFKGRKIWQNMTWSNQSQQAVDIGHRQFRTFLRAIGKLSVHNTAETHGSFFWATVGPAKLSAKEKAEGYEPKAEIKNFHAAANYNLMPDGSVVKAGSVPKVGAGSPKWTPPVAAAPSAAVHPAAGTKWTPPAAATRAAAPDPNAAATEEAVAAARAEDAAKAAQAATEDADGVVPPWQQ